MMPNKAESVVSKSEQASLGEGVNNLDDAEYRNLLENATLPTYASGLKKDANCNEAPVANGIRPLSATTDHYLTTLRKEADASQTAADAESERAHEALFYVSSSRTHPRTKLSKCASQDSTMSGIYRSGPLHTRTRSGPAVGVDEQIDMFRQPNARNEVRITIPDLPFIDHDQEDLLQQQDPRAWQRLVNGQQPVAKKVKNVEPANQEVELQPLLDSQQGSPVADDDDDSIGEPGGDRFHQRGKMGSYDVSNNIVNNFGYTRTSDGQQHLFDQRHFPGSQHVTSNRVGGLHSPPTEREMTVSGRGSGMHYGTNRSQTQRGVRPARPDFNQRKKNRDGKVKEVIQSDQIPGHMGGLPLDELVTLIEGPKPTGGKKKSSLPDSTPTSGGKKSSRSGDSSQSLDEQALGASDDADGEDSEETEQWVSADEGPVSETAESPKSEPKVFSLDLNDSRLYRADDESLPTTPTPTADDAEFIPVQTKKKHHKDNQQHKQPQQREQKLTGRRSYDSQLRATTPPPSSRSQQPSPGGSIAGSQKGANKPPVYPATNQRARRNSANQVKVDTDEQTAQDEHEATAAHSRRPPQPSPKAPSEPDRSRRSSDANLSQNARPSYSAIAGRPRRPPTASFGDFIDDSAMKRTPRNAASLHTSRCGSPDHHAHGRHGQTGRPTAAASNQANASSPDLFSYRTAHSSHGHHPGAMAKALLSPPLPPSMHKADGLELEDPPLSMDEASMASAAPVWQGPSWADIAKSSRSPTSSSQQPSPSPRATSSDEVRSGAMTATVASSSTEVVSLDATIVAVHQQHQTSPSAAISSTTAAPAGNDDIAAADGASIPIPLSSTSATASVSATLETPVASSQSTLCAVHEETIGELQDEQEHAGQQVDDYDEGVGDDDDVAMSDDGCDIRSVKGSGSSASGRRGGPPTHQRRDIRDSTSFVILPGEEGQQPQLDISFFYEPSADDQQQQLFEEEEYDEQLENGERTPTAADAYEEEDEGERPATVTSLDGTLRLSFGDRTLTFFAPAQPMIEIAKLPTRHSRMAVDVAKQWKEFVQGTAPTRYKDVVSSRRQPTATTGH